MTWHDIRLQYNCIYDYSSHMYPTFHPQIIPRMFPSVRWISPGTSKSTMRGRALWTCPCRGKARFGCWDLGNTTPQLFWRALCVQIHSCMYIRIRIHIRIRTCIRIPYKYMYMYWIHCWGIMMSSIVFNGVHGHRLEKKMVSPLEVAGQQHIASIQRFKRGHQYSSDRTSKHCPKKNAKSCDLIIEIEA